MRLSHYSGTTQVRCLACGQSRGDRPMFADLDGEPFAAYYHTGCLTTEQIIEGLRRMQESMDASAATYYRAHEGRYQGD